MKLRYTPRARLDLAEIHDHIAQENRQVARQVVSLIRQEAEKLLLNPGMGRRSGRVEGTRELVIGRYPFIVAYAVAVNEIQMSGSAYIEAMAGVILIQLEYFSIRLGKIKPV
ncbi:MAG: type II toxin-antitoxin system mRNA interferase toxin, RelE/StbE family [Hydrogenophilales bacterium CG18_big_fil_WC_8_21_14_2_50_58_12]|nr:MAG: type II toxin-antitoxin system mRNA interferase toxin, RelE/StbE family [Hydrogenophilales bacterium CG18_big_fil_WC_8_21_14_2_50_58_12]